MASFLNFRGLASRLFSPVQTALTQPPISGTVSTAGRRTLTTTPPALKGASPALSARELAKRIAQAKEARQQKGGKRGRQQAQDPKIVNMKRHFGLLNPRVIPPPLRMGRNRHLRHWTIHRAWLLFLRNQRDDRERARMRQYQSMYRACEELRLTEGPGTRDRGYLYRVAMEKHGVYRQGGIPIEYAKAQTETPGRVPWNHDWKP